MSTSSLRTPSLGSRSERDPRHSIGGVNAPSTPSKSHLPTPSIRPQRSMASLGRPPTPKTPVRSQATSSTSQRLSRPSSARQTPVPGPRPQIATIRTQRSMSALKPAASPRASPTTPTRVPPVPIIPRTKTPTTSRATKHKAQVPAQAEAINSPSSPGRSGSSIREQIAQRRAEAKKAKAAKSPAGFSRDSVDVPDDVHWAQPVRGPEDAEDDLLGRPSIRQTIEKARTTGILNLMARQLTMLPALLFAMHLGVTPKPLKSSPNTTVEIDNIESSVAWYEAQDLTVLKAGDNEIEELQEEIGLFGSLKSIDLHRNRLSVLPPEFCDLGFLTYLDISSCQFEAIPPCLSTLPSLLSLNISNNRLTSLLLALPSDFHKPRPSDAFYAPTSRLPDRPFPSLQMLLASGNKITGGTMDAIPSTLLKIDLSQNPLGDDGMGTFLTSLGRLAGLKDARLHDCDISDAGLPGGPLASASFPKLEALDLGGNDRLSEARVREVLLSNRNVAILQDVEQTVVDGVGCTVVRLSVGKIVKKETWEIEAERKSRLHNEHVESSGDEEGFFGLDFGSGSKAQQTPATIRVGTSVNVHASSPEVPAVIQKEQWEIDAETGLNTAAGRRRAEIAAAAAVAAAETKATAEAANVANIGTSLDKYYNASRSSLVLPAAIPATRRNLSAHVRSMSLNSTGASVISDPLVPTPTLPLSLIQSHPWSATLRVLELSNRRTDVCFLLSGAIDIALGRLEELKLDGCNLGDVVRLISSTSAGGETRERLIVTLRRLFPNVRSLDLSYNLLTTLDGIEEYFLPTAARGAPESGLRILRAQGNRIVTEGLEGLVNVGKRLQGASSGVDGWRGEEVDLRENEIAKLPAELGLLRLDILLVEGNLFRSPNRRIWERDGTKGLLTWLRDTL